jgi:hypothetical protein
MYQYARELDNLMEKLDLITTMDVKARMMMENGDHYETGSDYSPEVLALTIEEIEALPEATQTPEMPF